MFNDEGLGTAMGRYAAEQKVVRLEKRVEELERRLSVVAALLRRILPPDLENALWDAWPSK